METEHKLRLRWYCGCVNHVPPEDRGGWIKVKQIPLKPLLLQSNYAGERKGGGTHSGSLDAFFYTLCICSYDLFPVAEHQTTNNQDF